MYFLYLDNQEDVTEIGLILNDIKLDSCSITDRTKLAECLLVEITQLFQKNKIQIKDLDGIVCFLGPSSFTGLRITLSTANALAYSLNIPISGAGGKNWLSSSLRKLKKNPSYEPLLPNYGADPNITTPKK